MCANKLALMNHPLGNFESMTHIPPNQTVIACSAQPCAARILTVQQSCQKSGPKTRVLKVRMNTHVMQATLRVDQRKANHNALMQRHS